MSFKRKIMKENSLFRNDRVGTSGITLIALVITIIVLLIFAGVSIASLTGENGILTRAETARDNTEESTVEEKVKLAVQGAYTKGRGIIERDDLDNELKELFGAGKYEISDGDAPWTVTVEDYEATVNSKGKVSVAEVEDPDDQDPPKPGNPDEEGYFTEPSTINGGEVSATNPKIPAGFMPVDEGEAVWGDGTTAPTEEAVNEGLVIQDKNDNQFVWVPVSVFTNFERKAGYYNGAQQPCTFTSTGLEDGKYYEPKGDGENVDATESKTIQETQKMYKSVKENKGFYIGRYETGTTATSGSGIRGEAIIQKNANVYNNIGWSNSTTMTVETGGAVEVARGFDELNGYTNVTSTLCYSVQWDAVISWMERLENPNATGSLTKYIQDSTGMGWHASNSGYSTQKTGIDVDENASNKVKNIYDMAGNAWEWTMETCDSDKRVGRGGSCWAVGRTDPVSHRYTYEPNEANARSGFRIALYIE